MDQLGNPGGEDNSHDFQQVTPEALDTMFKNLPTADKVKLLSVSSKNYKGNKPSQKGQKPSKSSSSGKTNPDSKSVASFLCLKFKATEVLVTTKQAKYPNEKISQQVMKKPNALSELDEMPQSFWNNVKEVNFEQREWFDTNPEVQLLNRRCSNMEIFHSMEPDKNLTSSFKGIFDKHQSFLKAVVVAEMGYLAEGKGRTVFDYGWVANCSALEELLILTNGNESKNFDQIPLGIKGILSTQIACVQDLERAATYMKNLEYLLIWADVPVGPGSGMNLQLLKKFLNLPKLKELGLCLSSKGLKDPKVLLDQLKPLKEFCDSVGSGGSVKSELSYDHIIMMFGIGKVVHCVFTCTIDRDKFRGI